MQQMLIDVSGRPFPELLKSAVLDPAGMRHSTFQQPLPADWAARAASGHRSDRAVVKGKWHVYPEMAAAGFWTTASDLALFGIEIARSYNGNSGKVLSAAMTKQMLTPQLHNYGLGFLVEGSGETLRFSHDGADEGFQAALIDYPKTAQGVAIMTNSDHGLELAKEIIFAVAREYGWQGERPIERVLISSDPASFSRYTGQYRAESGPTWTVSVKDGKLFLSTGDELDELFPEGEAKFFLMGGGEVTFQGAANGPAAAFVYQSGDFSITEKRIQ
jgi:CubicO group peptidase (beta-lactamase class C family)